MYLIEFVTDRYSYGGISKIQVGYKESEESAKEYCERKTKELEGTNTIYHVSPFIINN